MCIASRSKHTCSCFVGRPPISVPLAYLLRFVRRPYSPLKVCSPSVTRATPPLSEKHIFNRYAI